MKIEPPDMIVMGLTVLLILLLVLLFVVKLNDSSNLPYENLDILLAYAATLTTGILMYVTTRNKNK